MSADDNTGGWPDEARYLIRKGGAFYRPNAQGYTRNKHEAGRYTLAEAKRLTHPNGPSGPRDDLDYVHEDNVPDAPICLTPSEIAAREAAAWCAGRDAAAEYADSEEAYSSKRADTENHHDQVWFGSSAATAGSIASHVRALTPSADLAAALEAVVREAAMREREALVSLVNGWSRELFGDADDYKVGWNDACEKIATAIRARGDSA